MLICYILSQIGTSMSFDQLHQSLRENSLVNYFDLVQAVEGLQGTGHLALGEGEPDRYCLTTIGEDAAREFTPTLPLSVREKAVGAAELLLKREQRLSEVSVVTVKLEEGYRLELALPDGAEGMLVQFSLFLPTEEECSLVRRRFLNDPLFIYKGVTALLTGDREVLGEIFPEKEPLF